ncbi:uncharacterized protein LOC142364008 isoform X4 [Opisthocomus hoazin]|uniref:uncharacterized protein LOC142364008 isoform X4 n=1 Tax=Opisthocomus hoazin TaxID=30419 RepID=UPI003F538575
MTSVHKGFAKTLAAVNPQLKFLEPCSDFHQGQESCSCDFVWMWPAPGLQLALCLLTLEKKSPASLQELKYGDLQTGDKRWEYLNIPIYRKKHCPTWIVLSAELMGEMLASSSYGARRYRGCTARVNESP